MGDQDEQCVGTESTKKKKKKWSERLECMKKKKKKYMANENEV
jgi:hypothetical protein